MKRYLSLLFAIPSIGLAQTSFEESEGVLAGASSVLGWNGDLTVSTENARTGIQSLLVTDALRQGGPAATVTYLDFWTKVTADSSEDPAAFVDFGGAAIAFLREGASGSFYAFDGRGEGMSVPVLAGVVLDASGKATEWTRITIRRDWASRSWDLFCNGRLAAHGLGLDAPAAGAPEPHFKGATDGELFIDDFGYPAANPLFTDTDNDGIPDAYEVTHGMNFKVDDRQADANSDGVANITDFANSLSGSVAPQSGTTTPHVIYVDRMVGSDSYTGSYSYAVNGDGPKASVHSAMESAGEGCTIAVIEGVYDEGEISLAGKPFNLVTVGKVKF